MALCFVNFFDYLEYGVACDELSELSFYLLMKPEIFCPGASAHEGYDVKMSASDVHLQHKIWIIPQPTN